MIGRIFIFLSFIVFTVSATGEGASKKVLDLYYTPGSAPCRAVMLTAKSLDIDMNLIHVNLFNNEHKSPKFLKINPQHTLPTLVDGEKKVTESQAIVAYLVLKYAENSPLFPKGADEMTTVLERLSFNATSLYLRFSEAYYPLIQKGVKFTDEQIQKLNEAIQFLNNYLEKSEYMAGDQITVADFSILASVTTIQAVDHDFSMYPKIGEWMEKVIATFSPEDYEEANGKGVKLFRKYYLDNVKPTS